MAFLAYSVLSEGLWPVACCIVPRVQSLPPWLGSGLWVQRFIAWVTLPLESGVRVVTSIRCSMFGLTALWACLLVLASLGHTPFTQWSPGHGGLEVQVGKGLDKGKGGGTPSDAWGSCRPVQPQFCSLQSRWGVQ